MSFGHVESLESNLSILSSSSSSSSSSQYQLSSLVHPPHFAGFRKFVIYTSAYISTHCLCSHTLPFCKLVCTGRPSFPTQLQVQEFQPSSRWQLNCYHLLPIHFPLDQELLILSPGFASKFLPGNWHGGHALLDYLYKVEEGLTLFPLFWQRTPRIGVDLPVQFLWTMHT